MPDDLRNGPLTRALVAMILAALLSACAATRLDANVHTVGTWPVGRVPGSFAFERLPSQEAHAREQDKLEAEALPAIQRAGFRHAAGEGVDVVVQVAQRSLQTQVGYGDPLFSPFWMGNAVYATRWRGPAWGAGWGWGAGYTVPYVVVEVSVLILDARSKQALYESRAQSDGSWPDDTTRAALFSAALADFPYNAVSPRRVTVDLPR